MAIQISGGIKLGGGINLAGWPQTYYNPTGSTYLDGTSQTLTIPASSALTLGTNDHTIEFWYYLPVATQAGGYATQWWYGSTTQQATNNYYFQADQAGGGSFGVLLGSGGGWGVNISAGATPFNSLVGRWSHIAITRSGSTFTLWLNGVSQGTNTYSGSISAQGGPMSIGSQQGVTGFAGGYYSNFRIVNGTCMYTSTFTPPVAPLTAVPGTALLTCQSPTSTTTDASGNNLSITNTGSATSSTANPFIGSTYFSASGKYLTPPANNVFNIANGTFTVEFWVNLTSATAGTAFAIGNGSAYGNAIYCTFDGSKFNFGQGVNGSNSNYQITSSSSYTTNTWYHIALVRNGSTLSLYINGTLQASGTNGTTAKTATQVVINGAYDNIGLGNSNCSCYMSNLRIVSGTAVYTSAFTPPVSPLTAIAGTVLLTCQSATSPTVDASANNFAITNTGSVTESGLIAPFNSVAVIY
jgi:hypothetical protein